MKKPKLMFKYSNAIYRMPTIKPFWVRWLQRLKPMMPLLFLVGLYMFCVFLWVNHF